MQQVILWKNTVRPDIPIFALVGVEEKIKELQDEMLEVNDRAQAIQATADRERRPLTRDEDADLAYYVRRFDELKDEIDRRRRGLAGRRSAPQMPGGGNIIMPGRAVLDAAWGGDGTGGFHDLGEFAHLVGQASRGMSPDTRLLNAPTTLSTEGIGSEGGFAVPPDFRAEIWNKVGGEGSLLALTDSMPTDSNSIEVPSDDVAPWDTTKGPCAYWEGEAQQYTPSKIALTSKTQRLFKLTSLVPVTEELLEDAPGLDAYLRRKVGGIFDFKISLAIIQGTGAGQPLGLLNSPSILSVEKVSGQGADTVVWDNIVDMWSALDANCAGNSVWVCNPSTRPQLLKMTIPVGTGGVPAYMPADAAAGRPFQTLMGQPIIFSQATEPLGSQGDIILADFSQYWTSLKRGGIRTDVSVHLWFDYDLMAYKFRFRLAGMPWWATPITGRDGSTKYSWAVTLDERA